MVPLAQDLRHRPADRAEAGDRHGQRTCFGGHARASRWTPSGVRGGDDAAAGRRAPVPARGSALEQPLVKRLDRQRQVGLVDHARHVHGAGRARKQVHRDAVERGPYPPPARAARRQPVADHGHQREASPARDAANGVELRRDAIPGRPVVDRDRHAGIRYGREMNRGARARAGRVGLRDRGGPVGAAGQRHLEDAEVLEARNPGSRRGSPHRPGGHDGAPAAGMMRVEDAHGDAGQDGGLHRRGMQDLRAAVRQRGGFVERQPVHGARPAEEPRVGGEHAVDVGPDLNLGRAQARADERRRVVRPSPAERRRHALGRRADEAAQHGNRAAVDERAHGAGELVSGRRRERRRLLVPAVGDHHVARVDPFGRHAGVPQHGGRQPAARQFAAGPRWRRRRRACRP